MAPMNTAIACSGMTRLMRRALMTVVLTLLGTADVVGIGRPPLVQAAQSEAAVPVVAGEVRRADVPIYLTGIGTVQAFNSVLVKARVDGQIVKIDFTEGQDVAAGDVLAEIDPAPLAAALAQTQAAKLKDEAQLDNARRDLGRATRLAASGNATIQQQDTARSLVAQLEATVKADQRNRCRSGPAQLHTHPLADKRSRRRADARCWQHSARDGCYRNRDGQPDPSYLCQLFASGGYPASPARRDEEWGCGSRRTV
jgi:multidrug efflux pump subunit AcrA (membrane-fusion protein)